MNNYDFNFELFYKHYPDSIKNDKRKIILYYFKNIDKFPNIYSEKFFYQKYPDFILDEFKKFNKVDIIDKINNFEIYNYYHNYKNKELLIVSLKDFNKKYNTFNLNIYINCNEINQINEINNLNEIDIIKYFINNPKENIIYSKETFYKKYDLDIDFYKIIYNINNANEEDLIINFYKRMNKINNEINNEIDNEIDNIIYNKQLFLEKYNDFSISIYKNLNKDLEHLEDKDLLIHWLKKGKYENRIYSITSFYNLYPKLKSSDEIIDKNFEENKIITWMNNSIYEYIKNKYGNIIGRNKVNNIYEVLIDLNQPKPLLQNGLSLIIRAKNEELNIKLCIESVIDLVDEIIFVDNGSTDNTYKIVEEYVKTQPKIKLYSYNIVVSKVGVEHSNALKMENKNTLGTFYNWCLSKATYYNVFKWDADFICIQNNFKNMVNEYNLRNRNDKFALWCTGKTLFENNNKYYYNHLSFYNEFRVFSYENNFKWYDGEVCEYTEPYLDLCIKQKKYYYNYPVFYEIKRTNIDEFAGRSSLIDERDINDLNIINSLKQSGNSELKLIHLDNNFINSNINIMLFTPSLSLGGGNQFIINMYSIYKNFGFNVKIIPIYENKLNIGKEKYTNILQSDIVNFNDCNIEYIINFNPNFIFFNSDVPYHQNNLINLSKFKIIFITHSDVAYANFFISKYFNYFYKIITVNDYTIMKLSNLLKIDNINQNKFYKLINYVDLETFCKSSIFHTNIQNQEYKKIKTKKFGVITRFSEDKNIPMFLNSLIKVFKLYPDYKCYLVGTHNEKYDNYLRWLVNIFFKISKNIFFEGYQDNTKKYYEMFDFIILPSVSEGCSYNIIEAMNYGVPIIASNVGGNHELLDKDFLYEYDGIRELEQKIIYIENYIQHLDCIGYIINNKNISKDEKFNDLEVLIPHLLANVNNNKIKIWNKNMNNITNSIIKLINMDDNNKIINRNIEFIKNKFNQPIYINQLLEVIS